MKDFEQLYYDQQYKIKKLENKIKQLEEELEIYKAIGKSKDIRNIIVSDLSKYIIKKYKDDRK